MESLRHQLGRYQYHSGHLEEAFDTLSKLPVCILLVISALHCRKFEEVCILLIKLDTYAPKLDDGDDRKAIHFKSLCARGLANMARGHYYAAAVLVNSSKYLCLVYSYVWYLVMINILFVFAVCPYDKILCEVVNIYVRVVYMGGHNHVLHMVWTCHYAQRRTRGNRLS